jgi:hypothetical protein
VGALVPLPALWHVNGAGIGFRQRSCKAEARYVAKVLPSAGAREAGWEQPWCRHQPAGGPRRCCRKVEAACQHMRQKKRVICKTKPPSPRTGGKELQGDNSTLIRQSTSGGKWSVRQRKSRDNFLTFERAEISLISVKAPRQSFCFPRPSLQAGGRGSPSIQELRKFLSLNRKNTDATGMLKKLRDT